MLITYSDATTAHSTNRSEVPTDIIHRAKHPLTDSHDDKAGESTMPLMQLARIEHSGVCKTDFVIPSPFVLHDEAVI